MSSLRPSKSSGSKLPTVAKSGAANATNSGLKRPLGQQNLSLEPKKARTDGDAGPEKSNGLVRANSTSNTRPGLAQRATRATANNSLGTNLTRSTSNLSKKGNTAGISRSNSASNRGGLASRVALNKAPTMSQKEICEKLLTLEKRMEENTQTINTPLKIQRTALKLPAAKEQVEQLSQEKEALNVESTRYREEVQQRIEEVGALKREKMDLNVRLEDCQEELSRVKMRLESKTIELENLEKSYQALDTEHRSYKRDMDLKEADNKRLSNLLDREQDETRRLKAEVAEAIREKEAAKARMRENETRLRYIHNQMLELKGNIRVFARIRPVAEEEGESAVATAPEETLTVAKPNPKIGGKPVIVPFQFDRVLGEDVPQCDVFEEVEQLVISALDGYNICIFAYGQTGSGKTYTMEGPPGLEFEDETQEVHFGIIPRAIRRVFQLTEERKENGWEYTLGASFIEIYNETIQDLLDKNKKECNIRLTTDPKKGEGVFVENMLSVPVTSVRQIAQLMEKARKHRSVAATKCNERSSRSHCVFQLHITARNSINEVNRESVLNLVDLAGSERVKDSGAEGARFTETKNINSSLTQLSTVMMSLGNKAAHIPYRNSKLTHLLSTSLGGNSKTLMIVNVSPAAVHVSETINSLKFAQKVNEVHIGPASKNNK